MSNNETLLIVRTFQHGIGEIAEEVTNNLTKTRGRGNSKSNNLINMSVCIRVSNKVWDGGKKLKY